MAKKVIGKPRFERGPITAEVFAAVAAGQVCTKGTAGNAGKIGPAGADGNPFGIATTPGMPAGTSNTNTSPSGFSTTDMSVPTEKVAFARRGAYYLAAAGTIAFLDYVKCAAAGAVVKWDPTADALIPQVGQCIDTDGATNGNPVLIDVNIKG